LAGGKQISVFAGSEQDYKVTVEQLDKAKTKKTKAIMFVSPSNPTGAVYSEQETEDIANWALDNGIWIIADEIYQNLTYDGVFAHSPTELVPEVADQTIMVNGVAKTYAMTGWRVGWMVSPADVSKAAANLQSHLSSNVANVSQRAALAALTGPQQPALEMLKAFDRRRKLILSELAKIPGFHTPEPKGAFYVYPDVTSLLGRNWGGVEINSSLELCDYILEKAEVAIVPGEAFGPSGYLRMSYALGDDALLEGVQRLQKLFS
jgi:aspartate aminotransferase